MSMNNPIINAINTIFPSREKKAADIINDIDNIATQGMRSNVLETPAFNRSISGKLKKRFAPDRHLAESGIHLNRFNMTDLYSAYVGENLIKFAVDKYTEATVKNGFYIDSKNPSVVKYLNKRLKEIEVVSNSSMKDFLTDLLVSIILYGNGVIIKHRQEAASSGKRYTRWDGAELEPIASLYVEDFRKLVLGEGPAGKSRYVRLSMNVDDFNINLLNPSIFSLPKNDLSVWSLYKPSYYMFNINTLFTPSSKRNKEYIVYDEDEICHVRYHHIPGEKIAMPPFWPTLNDIDSLRRIEENVELLVYQYGHPILHAKVGDDKKYGDDAEIQDVTYKLEAMENNGFLTTDNRTELKFIGAESAAVRVETYLSYFYKRALTGLWLSEVAVGIGDTANRSTANTLDKLSQEKVVELQKITSDAMQSILIELLLEAGIDLSWALRPENLPAFVFNPVDVEGLIRKESHVLSKWQANMITEDEMRRELGLEPLENINETYNYLHTIPLSMAKATLPKDSGTATANKTKQNKLTPANQHGKKTGPSQTQN